MHSLIPLVVLCSDPHNDAAVPLLRLASSAVGVLIVLAALGITLVGLGEAWAGHEGCALGNEGGSRRPLELLAPGITCTARPAPPPLTGFHIGPLLASVGGMGVVLGFASQQLLANLASAVSIVSGQRRRLGRGCPAGAASVLRRHRLVHAALLT